jgi:hypothetical protein
MSTPSAALTDQDFPLEGGCSCRAVRYRVLARPLVVHCCHCTYCQRESGSAFAINAVIERSQVALISGEPHVVDTPSHSGKGQKIARCPRCSVAVWSLYAAAGEAFRFLRTGTLDRSGVLPPDIHIYTSTKQPWVVLPEGARQVPEFYRPPEVWTEAAMARWRAARAAG